MNRLVTFRNKILEKLTHNLGVPLLMKIRKSEPFHYSMVDLENFPEGTVGKDLVVYLKQKEFTLMKNYERHDCKHIIFGYEMNQLGEAEMQFYFLGNGHFSLPVISTVISYLILMPEEWSTFYREFKRGKKGKTVKSLNKLQHNQLVTMKTADVRKEYLNEAA